MTLTILAVYAFLGVATFLSACKWDCWQETVASALIGVFWPLFIAARIINKITG